MGRKNIVPYGLYRCYGFVNPYLARDTGFTDGDLELLWQVLKGTMWEIDRSASRGLMATRGLYVFEHASMLGNAPHTNYSTASRSTPLGRRRHREGSLITKGGSRSTTSNCKVASPSPDGGVNHDAESHPRYADRRFPPIVGPQRPAVLPSSVCLASHRGRVGGQSSHRRRDARSSWRPRRTGTAAGRGIAPGCPRAVVTQPALAVGRRGRSGRVPAGTLPRRVQARQAAALGQRRRATVRQALCLEEMFAVAVPAGAVFQCSSGRRREIVFDDALRQQTEAAVARLHELLASNVTPPPVVHPKCRQCSLYQLCLPELVVNRPAYDRAARALFQVHSKTS